MLMALAAGCGGEGEQAREDSAFADASGDAGRTDSFVGDVADAFAPTDAVSDVADTATVKDAKPKDTGPKTYAPTDVLWVFVDDSSGGGVGRHILITADCEVTYNGKALGKGAASDCATLFTHAVDTWISPTWDCTPTTGWNVVSSMETKDGVTHLRDLNLERCAAKLPGGGGWTWKDAIYICSSVLGADC